MTEDYTTLHLLLVIGAAALWVTASGHFHLAGAVLVLFAIAVESDQRDLDWARWARMNPEH